MAKTSDTLALDDDELDHVHSMQNAKCVFVSEQVDVCKKASLEIIVDDFYKKLPGTEKFLPGSGIRGVLLVRRTAVETASPLFQGKLSILALSILILLRFASWCEDNAPPWGSTVWIIHLSASVCDATSVACTLPLYISGTQGQCVRLGHLGPMMTLIFIIVLADAILLVLIAFIEPPLFVRSHIYLDILEGTVSVWEWLLLGSVACQTALCVSSWRIYRHLRMAGIYPPQTEPYRAEDITDVSVMEVMCEAEDVDTINACDVCAAETEETGLLEENLWRVGVASDADIELEQSRLVGQGPARSILRGLPSAVDAETDSD